MAAGVIKEISDKQYSFYKAKEVMELLDVSRDTAYKLIASLRQELIDKGKLTEGYPRGRIPKKYFNERCMIE